MKRYEQGKEAGGRGQAFQAERAARAKALKPAEADRGTEERLGGETEDQGGKGLGPGLTAKERQVQG